MSIYTINMSSRNISESESIFTQERDELDISNSRDSELVTSFYNICQKEDLKRELANCKKDCNVVKMNVKMDSYNNSNINSALVYMNIQLMNRSSQLDKGSVDVVIVNINTNYSSSSHNATDEALERSLVDSYEKTKHDIFSNIKNMVLQYFDSPDHHVYVEYDGDNIMLRVSKYTIEENLKYFMKDIDNIDTYDMRCSSESSPREYSIFNETHDLTIIDNKLNVVINHTCAPIKD